jgi:hypothetical protein
MKNVRLHNVKKGIGKKGELLRKLKSFPREASMPRLSSAEIKKGPAVKGSMIVVFVLLSA